MDPSFRKILKYLALIARGVGLFPLMIIVSYVYRKPYVEDLFWVQLVGTIIVVVMGYAQVCLLPRLQERWAHKKRLAQVIVGILYMIEFFLMIYWCREGLKADGLMKFFTAIIYIALYLLSVAAYEKHYTNVLSMEWMIGISAIYVFAMLLCHYSVLGVIYIVIIGSYLFLNNQFKLEELLRTTKENTPMFKRIRKDNMKWVGIVVGIILMMYPLRKPIWHLLEWCYAKCLIVLGFVIRIILKILALLSPNESPVESMPGESGMGVLSPTETNPWLDVLFWICVVGVTLYVSIRYRKQIINGIKQKIRQIQLLIEKIYKLLFKKENRVVVATKEYEDTIEDLSEWIVKQERKASLITQRKWTRQVKRYIKQSSVEVEYREGYRLLLQGLKLQGIAIKRDTTPREIVELVGEKVTLPSINQETHYYEEIRYNSQVAQLEEIEQLKKLLQALIMM